MKTRSARRVIPLETKLVGYEWEVLIQMKNRAEIEAKREIQASFLANTFAERNIFNRSKILILVSKAIKEATDSIDVRPHHLRHTYVCLRLYSQEDNLPSQPDSILKNSWNREIKNCGLEFVGNSPDWKPSVLSRQLGHSNPSTTLKWYSHLADTFVCYDVDQISQVKPSVVYNILEVKENSYRTSGRRAFGEKVKKSSLPYSTIYSYKCGKSYKQLNLDSKISNIELDNDLSLIHI